MRVYSDSWEQCRENIAHKVSSESPYSILHIASISPRIIASIQTVGGGGDNSLNPPQNKKAMTEQCVTVGQSPVTEMSLATPFNTVHIIHIYTDSGVMYKTGNGRNLRHYARGFSISRLHLSSTKFADNTKGHFFKIIN